ncbi:MAG: hypothetical protein K9H49_06660 [Bacteroidales bacterium]|nr:hypothetical protein [Bacteroidales bacterium]MCF8389355.1 hypothetical protein [Bacteroidales bacterium]
MKVFTILFLTVLSTHLFSCAPKINTSESSTKVFEAGNSILVVYSDVPGLAPSEFYNIRVRSKATKNEWQSVFPLISHNLISSLPEGTESRTGGTIGHYQKNTRDWSHTYGNIEMNGPVEVEISTKPGVLINGKPIFKATTHPSQKASEAKVVDAKVYFTIDKPGQIIIDINGQMDDQETGGDYSGPTIHSIALYANPIMDKPSMENEGVLVLNPGQKPPTDPNTYTTLYFAPGIHDLGKNIKLHSNKNYFIPGDAIVYGTFNNFDLPSGENIKLYGLGTISGDRLMHPLYDDDHKVRKEPRENWKSVSVKNAINVEVLGVSVSNCAEHSVNLQPENTGEYKGKKITFVRWAKVVSWRANGDGIGSAQVAEDCFIRTSDDCSYVKGDRIRCTFWKDSNGAIFHMANIPDDISIVIEDCDLLYNRNKNDGSMGGGVFVQRSNGKPGQQKVDVLVQNFRIHDKYPNVPIFSLVSKFNHLPYDHRLGGVGSSYSGITFRNVTAVAEYGKEKIIGCSEAPWNGGITFENVVIGGKKVTSLDDFELNEFVSDITFK